MVRRRGSGNYVAPHIEQPLSSLSSFSEQLEQRGYRPSSTWLRREVVLATTDEQLVLGLPHNSRVARLERLRLADDVAMAYEVTVIPASMLPRPQEVTGSLYAHLDRNGHLPVRATQHIRAMNAPKLLAERLDVPEGRAVLFITRTGYLASGVAVELTHSYCRSDHYDFVAEMQRAA